MENLTKYVGKGAMAPELRGPMAQWALHAPSPWIVPVVLAYPLLVMSLRYRRLKSLERKYQYSTLESLAKMTDAQAHEILSSLSELEFPAMYEKGLQFALFRTYGIPSISKLLVRTSQLSSSKNVGKRYADTTVLLAELYGNKPSDERTLEAFGRLNFLHGHYLDSGQITNDDMLYTLSLFALEPIRWIDRTEWRRLSKLERCAMGVFHKSMGDAMLINYDVLPSAKTGFRDGLHWLEEIRVWADDYEAKVMIPDENNRLTAEKTRVLVLSTMPDFMKPLGSKAISAAMDDRLRHAIKFEDPPAFYDDAIKGFLLARKMFLRYLALPRPSFMRSKLVSESVDEQGRRNFTRYDNLPFYVKPTFMNRWGPGAWGSRLMGLPLPGDEGYAPEGFYTPDVGPKMFTGKGAQAANETKERLRRERNGGCPFAVSHANAKAEAW